MKIRSYVSPRADALRRAVRAGPGCTVASGGSSPRAARFDRITATARASRSTSSALAAPRDRASMASAPEPANTSSTRAPSSGPRVEKSASRTRSDVGRVLCPGGAFSRRPPKRPATTRTASRGRDRLRLGVRELVGEQRELGRRQRRVLVEQARRARVGALEDVGVLRQPREAKAREAGLPRPGELALAAQLEVDLGEREAVAVLGERPQPSGLLRPEQQAQRLVRAAADPPA